MVCIFILIILIFSGCASPYASQYNAITTAYQNGQLTYPEYVQAYQNIQMQDMAWRQNLSQSLSAAGRSYSESQNQPIRVLSNPVYHTQCYTSNGHTECTSQ